MTPGIITSYAQNFEDVILWRAFGKLAQGFYIDIGAQDPVVDSVSLGFYEQGWRGIHLEPNAHYADLLRRHRSDEVVIQAAVSDKPELLSFFEVADSGMSTLMSDVAEEIGRRGWAVSQTMVPAVTLDQVFGSVPQGLDVHWLKIDAEGAEGAILSGWRDSTIRPPIILLEAIDPFDQSPNHQSWEPTLLAKAYHFVYFDGINRFYVADEHTALDQHFRYGPCVLDQFQLPDSSRLLGAAFQENLEKRQSLETEVDQLREQLSRQNTEFAAAKIEWESVRAENDAEKRELAQVRAEAVRLNAQNARLREKADDAFHLRKKLEQAQSLLTRMDRDIRADTLLPDDVAVDDLMAPGALTQAAPIRSVQDMMSLPDEVFVEQAYEIVLGRAADPVGLAYHFRKLSEGHSRLSVLGQLRRSREGRARQPGLVDLDEKISGGLGKRSSLRSWLRQRFVGPTELLNVAAEIEAIARKIERLSQLADVQRKIAGRISQLLAVVNSVSAVLDTDLQSGPARPEDAAPSIKLKRLGESPESKEIEGALDKALDSIGASREGAGMTVVVGEPTTTLNASERPAILVGPDWAETGFPPDWPDLINGEFAGVGCISRHARKILIDHGVSVPIDVVGFGLDEWNGLAPVSVPDLGEKRFRFVHVARRLTEDGTDLALRAFGRTFRGHTDVSLVVACHPGEEARVQAQLDTLRSQPDSLYPHVVVLPSAWDHAELASLFAHCDVLLAPARAMQFSSAVALAIYARLPVIATRWGGHMDYCSGESTWLVEYEFERATSSRKLVSSAWARVLDTSLDDALRAARTVSREERGPRLHRARRLLDERLSWDAVAGRLAELSRRVASPRPLVGWVTTWNVKCGIASAVANLVETLPSNNVAIFAAKQEPRLREDTENCHRLWQAGKAHNDLASVLHHLVGSPVDALVIHFNYGFYNHAELSSFIETAVDRGIVVILDLHSTVDPWEDPNMQLTGLIGGLRRCHRILAHGTADMNRLKAIGLVDNVTLFPLGVISRTTEGAPGRPSGSGTLLASFGFCLPGKGLPELVEAISLLRDAGRLVRLRMLNARHTAPQSQEEIDRIEAAIEHFDLKEQIEFQTEYLTEDDCLKLLQEADAVINPYQSTGEAASAAVRMSLASRRPVIVTPIPIFDDLQNAVFRTPGTSPAEIAAGIASALDEIENKTAGSCAVRDAAEEWLNVHDFKHQAATLMNMISALQGDQRRIGSR